MCGVSCIRSTAGYCICTNELRFYHPPLHRKSRGRRHEEHSSQSWVVGLSNASFHLVHTVCQYWCKGEECDASAGKKGYGPTHALCAISKLCNRRLSGIARPSTTFPSHRRCVHQHPVRSETCVHTTSPHRASGTIAPMGPHMLGVQPPGVESRKGWRAKLTVGKCQFLIAHHNPFRLQISVFSVERVRQNPFEVSGSQLTVGKCQLF